MKISDIRLAKIKELIQDMGSQADFANKIKRTPQQVSAWLKQEKSIGEKIARHIEHECGLDIGYLDKLLDQKSVADKVLLIPMLKSSISKLDKDSSNLFPVDKVLIKSLGRKPDTLYIFTANGESMSPTIKHNSITLVDTSQAKILDGKIDALSKNNEIFLRRVFHQIGNTGYEAKSDNEKYGKIVFKDGGHVKVIGRVVYLLCQ